MTAKVATAMVLAAGQGTRLKPLTLKTPKVLLPVGGVPLICHTLAWLKRHGISQVVINLHHLGEQIQAFLGDGSRFGVEIHYSIEESLLGTAGGVKRAGYLLDGTFAVVYGDILTDFDLSAMLEFHREKEALATVAVSKVAKPSGVGVVKLKKEGRIVSFVEKPSRGARLGNVWNGGIYILEKQILDSIPGHGSCDFAYDIFPKLIKAGLPLYGYTLTSTDYLIDIGTVDKYLKANQDVKLRKTRIEYGKQSCSPG